MKINKETRDTLIEIAKDKNVLLEGNLLKIIEADDDDVEFKSYLQNCITQFQDIGNQFIGQFH